MVRSRMALPNMLCTTQGEPFPNIRRIRELNRKEKSDDGDLD